MSRGFSAPWTICASARLPAGCCRLIWRGSRRTRVRSTAATSGSGYRRLRLLPSRPSLPFLRVRSVRSCRSGTPRLGKPTAAPCGTGCAASGGAASLRAPRGWRQRLRGSRSANPRLSITGDSPWTGERSGSVEAGCHEDSRGLSLPCPSLMPSGVLPAGHAGQKKTPHRVAPVGAWSASINVLGRHYRHGHSRPARAFRACTVHRFGGHDLPTRACPRRRGSSPASSVRCGRFRRVSGLLARASPRPLPRRASCCLRWQAGHSDGPDKLLRFRVPPRHLRGVLRNVPAAGHLAGAAG